MAGSRDPARLQHGSVRAAVWLGCGWLDEKILRIWCNILVVWLCVSKKALLGFGSPAKVFSATPLRSGGAAKGWLAVAPMVVGKQVRW